MMTKVFRDHGLPGFACFFLKTLVYYYRVKTQTYMIQSALKRQLLLLFITHTVTRNSLIKGYIELEHTGLSS